MGKIAIVDDCDSDLAQLNWRTNPVKKSGNNYGVREIWNKGNRYTEHLHRVILERKIGRKLKVHEVTDHIDRNGLNNRRENLRAVTQSVNMTNARRRFDNKSGYPGIFWNKARKGFDVYINKNHKRYRFGRFKNLDEAIKARQEAEKKIWQLESTHQSRTQNTQ